jgi:uncharacterized protein YndB with AHSA1/START domain
MFRFAVMKNKEYIVHKKISIHAESLDVWDALTDPKKTKEYFFNCEVHSKWKPGSTITFKGWMFFFIKIEMKGKILKADPGKLLQYTLKNSGSPSTSTVTDTLTYENGKTIVSITDDVGQGEGAEKRYKKSAKGWDKILHGLKEFVETNK